MLNSIPRQIIFLMIFTVGIGFMLTEGSVGQYDKIFPITICYILPPFIITMLLTKRQILVKSKKEYIIESLRDACLCSLVVTLFIPTINRVLPPSTDYAIDGEIVDVKPGKGAVSWGLKIKEKNGQTIGLSVPRSKYPNVSPGDHFQLNVKRGGLGLLYGPRD